MVPAAPATHLKALSLFGTLSFEEAATPALELARDGFAMYPELRDSLEIHAAQIDRYTENASIYRPAGRVNTAGALITMVERCNTEMGLGMFPEDVTAVAAVLNRDHYRFK